LVVHVAREADGGPDPLAGLIGLVDDSDSPDDVAEQPPARTPISRRR
jgi:hypothetical protein